MKLYSKLRRKGFKQLGGRELETASRVPAQGGNSLLDQIWCVCAKVLPWLMHPMFWMSNASQWDILVTYGYIKGEHHNLR